MERGLYIAATGMLSDIVRQDVIASNLANVNTAGYKADRVVNESFSDLFLRNMDSSGSIGPLNMGTRVAAVVTDYSQGSLRNTGNALDVAIAGDGFFRVQTQNGIAYTRDGQFQRASDGTLMTQHGAMVLDTMGRPINVGTSGDPTITGDGRIYVNGTLMGALGIVTLDIEAGARKVGDNLWLGQETGGQLAGTKLRQGFVEASGVNSVREMVDMITTMRSYESSQRVLTSIDGTLEKAVNSVGAVS